MIRVTSGAEFRALALPRAPSLLVGDEDGGRLALEDYRDDPTSFAPAGAIRSLDIDARLELVALIWIGRGDYLKEASSGFGYSCEDFESGRV